MSASPNLASYFSEIRQQYLIECLSSRYAQMSQIAMNIQKNTSIKQSVGKIRQLIMLKIVRNILGLSVDSLFKLVSPERALKLYKYIKGNFKIIPSRSWFYSSMNLINKHIKPEIEDLSTQLQDKFYNLVGENARIKFREITKDTKKKIIAPFEIFIGYFAPSAIFPRINTFERGILMPFLNLRIYQQLNHISGINELVGFLKTIEIESDTPTFKFSGRIGFINAPPGKNAIYRQMHKLESMLDKFDEKINEILTEIGIIDLTIVSVDSTCVPVDKRDNNRTNGTSSRGKFTGYKCSIASDANSVPLFSVVEDGKKADINLYRANMAPVYRLAKHSLQEIWIETSDAAYCSTYLMDDIDKIGNIHWIDINSRNSLYLKKLKSKANDLAILSKKAIKIGLNLEERKEWITDVKKNFTDSSNQIQLEEKKLFMKKILHKYAMRARNRGLTGNEQIKERRLRKEIMDIRAELRKSSQIYSKQIGLTLAPYGTIEWFLIYGIRGQNEGINGILKKKGNLLGDQQKTTWIYGKSNIRNRIQSMISMIKYCILIHYIVTGNKMHGMRYVYNWDRFNFCFVIFPQR